MPRDIQTPKDESEKHFPQKRLESSLASAILSSAEKAAFQRQLHWEWDEKADSRQKEANRALEMLRKALKPKA